MATATLEASFGGVPLVDPQELRDKTTPENLPQPWLGKANAYHCPIGPDAGEAWLLIRRKWLKTLDLNQRQTFTLQYRPTLQGSVNILNVQQMRVQSAVCVTPGQSEDDNGVYLLRATDQRWELSRYVTSRRFYNVRNSATPDDFYAWSEKSSAPWQWAEVFNDLWTNGGTGQGSSVGDEMIQWNLASFPFSGIQSDAPLPAAPPENVSIEFEPLLKSMQSIADLAGLWIRYDPHTHTLQLIAAGEFDDSVELAITSLENRLVWRDEMFDPLAQRLPFAIRVIYPVFFKSGRSEELSQRFQFAADGLKITDAGVSSSFAGDYSTAVDSIDPSVLDQSSIVTVYDSMAYLMDGASRNDAHYNSLIKQRTKDRYNQVLQYLTQVTSPGKGHITAT